MVVSAMRTVCGGSNGGQCCVCWAVVVVVVRAVCAA